MQRYFSVQWQFISEFNNEVDSAAEVHLSFWKRADYFILLLSYQVSCLQMSFQRTLTILVPWEQTDQIKRAHS